MILLQIAQLKNIIVNEKRKDNKGRILHNGEYQQSDGRYRFKYYDGIGNAKYLYSWRLDKNDRAPAGKRFGPSLREMEKNLQASMMDHIVLNATGIDDPKYIYNY